MQHTRFLKQKREGLLREMAEHRNIIERLQLKVDHIDEMLAEADSEECARQGADDSRADHRISTVPLRDVILRLLKGAPGNELALDDMIGLIKMEGRDVPRTTLQSTLSRNDDFRNVDSRIGKWALAQKPVSQAQTPRSPKEEQAEANIALEQNLSPQNLPPHIGQPVPATTNASAPRPVVRRPTPMAAASPSATPERPPGARPVMARPAANITATQNMPKAVSAASVNRSVGVGTRPPQPAYPVDDFDAPDPFSDE